MADQRRVARADRRTTRDLLGIGTTCRDVRVAAGTSQDKAGRAVGMSRSQVVRLEAGNVPHATLRQLNRLAAASGQKLVITLYPDVDPIRDVAHARLLERLRVRVGPGLLWRPEVPLAGRSGLRAWDAVVEKPPRRTGIEAETRIRDSQALERRLRLKLQDDTSIANLILLLADTAANRDVLRLVREAARDILPLDSREILAALSEGRLPDAGGIVLL